MDTKVKVTLDDGQFFTAVVSSDLTQDQLISEIGKVKPQGTNISSIEVVENRTPAEIAAQGEQEYAKMMDEIATNQGNNSFNVKSIFPMTTASIARTDDRDDWKKYGGYGVTGVYDALSFLPRLAVTGYRELGDAAGGLAMRAVGGENYYTPNVAKRMSGEDSNVFFDELGNPINYIPMAAAERAGGALISKFAPKVIEKAPKVVGKVVEKGSEFVSRLPKLVTDVSAGTARGATEGAGTEVISGQVEESAIGKTDRYSPIGGAAFGGVIGGTLAGGSKALKHFGEAQVLSEIKIPGRTAKGANAPDVKNLLEYPVEYLPENKKHKSIFGSKVDDFREKREYPIMRKLTGDETIGATRNLAGGDVSDILDRVNEIANGLVYERADVIKKIVDKDGYVNLDKVIYDVSKAVTKSKKYDIAEKKLILDELQNFKDTELKTLEDMQSLGEYKSSQSYDPIETGPFDYILDARERTRERAKFETIKDPRRDKPIADMYADLYRGINDKIFAPQKKIIHEGENISINNNIADEDIAGFSKTQEGLKRLVPFEVELPARSTVAKGSKTVGLPTYLGAGIGAPIGGIVGSLAGPAGTTAGALGGAGVGASLGTAMTRGTTAGKVMYETGKAIGPKRTLPKIVTPTASRIANEPFRTTYYRDEDGNLVETRTNKPLPSYKDVASMPALVDSTIKKLK